ncbi:anthranilate synthase component I family protein [Leucobacter musarum]|uniref:anthranilate synthase component I family protein n=1 Tax=Leucobacter musarum TaxID=1930747 RepID=UPI0009EB6C5D|nr:anthranilate synthase component I family protein [Leucobacter musarum]
MPEDRSDPHAAPSGAVRFVGTFFEDAVALARRFAAAGRAWCWFDGEVSAPGESRVSYFALASEVHRAERGRESAFLDALRAADAAPTVGSGDRSVCGGWAGGWAVALGYEFGVALLGIEPLADFGGSGRDDRGAQLAPGFALRCDVVLAIDHESLTARLHGPSEHAIDAWLAEHGGLLAAAAPTPTSTPTSVPEPGHSAEPRGAAIAPGVQVSTHPQWRRDDASYAREVDACRAAIRAGDAYVLCLTDTADAAGAPQDARSAVDVYARLRTLGTPIRGGIMDAGDRALVSASPERFLSVRGDRVVTHPIKGTRRRGDTAAADRELAEELAADPKERAENLMIVDLMRNDLSRVCVPGTVRVERFLEVETHAHVHQLVSTVAGRLSAHSGIWDAIAATFPGGSMTGAPKRRAVELLQQIEGGPRGLYSGCFGWVDRGGDAEIAMTIRSVELLRERAHGGATATVGARLGAGGGITIDSVPQREVAEKHLKAAALMAALTPEAIAD